MLTRRFGRAQYAEKPAVGWLMRTGTVDAMNGLLEG